MVLAGAKGCRRDRGAEREGWVRSGDGGWGRGGGPRKQG